MFLQSCLCPNLKYISLDGHTWDNDSLYHFQFGSYYFSIDYQLNRVITDQNIRHLRHGVHFYPEISTHFPCGCNKELLFQKAKVRPCEFAEIYKRKNLLEEHRTRCFQFRTRTVVSIVYPALCRLYDHFVVRIITAHPNHVNIALINNEFTLYYSDRVPVTFKEEADVLDFHIMKNGKFTLQLHMGILDDNRIRYFYTEKPQPFDQISNTSSAASLSLSILS